MTVVKKQLLHLLTGILAGVLAMGLVEAVSLLPIASYAAVNIFQGMALGAAFGLMFSLAEGFAGASYSNPAPRRYMLDLPWMILLSAGGGILAVLFSAQLLLYSGVILSPQSGPGELIRLAVLRGSAWLIPGGFIGSLEGIRRRSPEGTLAGFLGGIIGGFSGGISLELISALSPGSVYLRLVGYLILGISVGLFLGIFERRFAFARLRVLSGPYRNREFMLSERKISVGAGNRASVFLEGYGLSTAPEFLITRRGGDMVLENPLGNDVKVNEKAVEDHRILKYGDVIHAARAKLLLRTL